jgi:hypothetical protein
MIKPIHARPSLYSHYFFILKEIAFRHGYNLVLHGSLNRDLDLIAIPWQEEVKPYYPMIEQFAERIGGEILPETEERRQQFADMHHGRRVYVINLNRGGFGEPDPQYYIDISVIPLLN